MGDIFISTWDYFKKDFFKNTFLLCCVVAIPILSYNNLTKSEEIKSLNAINENLLQDCLVSKESLLTNHKNWNFLFESDIYSLYKSDSLLNSFINFSSDELYNLYGPKMQNLDLLEHNLKSRVSNLIYNQVHGEILINPMNYYQILFEIDTCFRKIGYLVQDKMMNDLLFKYHGINHPYYNPGTSALNNILKEKGHLPLSCDVEFLKNFSNKSCVENLHYSRFSINKFE